MIKKFGMLMALSATVCTGVFAAEEVLKLSSEGDFPSKMVEADGEQVFETVPGILKSKQAFEVDTEKTYILKGKFRNVSGKEVNLYFGFVPLDSKDGEILPQHVTRVAKSETELLEEVKPGDKIIKVKDGEAWAKATNIWVVAFNVEEDLSDLPNRQVSPSIVSVEGNEITLKTPIAKAYPAGTKVRAHKLGSVYLYTAASRHPLSDQWKEFSGKARGKSWRPGTAKAKILIYPHPSKDNRGAPIQFKDITVETE
ncbi:MAG: hypothetical protein WC198_03745 [Victivallaceae bacterium]